MDAVWMAYGCCMNVVWMPYGCPMDAVWLWSCGVCLWSCGVCTNIPIGRVHMHEACKKRSDDRLDYLYLSLFLCGMDAAGMLYG